MKILIALVAVGCFAGIVIVGFGSWLLSGMLGEPTDRQKWRDGGL